MQKFNNNDVLVYSITSAARSALPDWIAKTNKKSLQRDADYRNRIELLQDFEFPEASIRLRATRDGKNILATGLYKPQIRCFELDDLAMKWQRNLDSENVQFEMLSDDWTKLVMLQNDRTIEFHTQFGLHYRTRVPRFGRDLAYSYPTCDLLVCGASNDIWRLNLEQGTFLSPLPTDMPGVNVCEINAAHQLWGFGGDDGTVEFWHPTTRKRIAKIDVAGALARMPEFSKSDAAKASVTALKFADDGLNFAVGLSTGQVMLYDLRRPTPTMIKDHQYGFPIKNIEYHDSGNVISADTKIVKIWDKNHGKIFTSIEPPHDINDVLVQKDTGLVMIANEGVRIQSYYVPQLGPAPKWCPFLDNLTEELEEKTTETIYDDYKFVTRKELSGLGLDHLLGTNMLRAYMHGFFIDLRLYEKAKSIASPFDYANFKKAQVQSKIEKERGSRIRASRNLPKVNRELATKLLSSSHPGILDSSDDSDDLEGGKVKKTSAKKKSKMVARENATAENPLGDDRFAAAFKDEAFAVDTTNPEYTLHYPVESKKAVSSRIADFEKVEESEEESEAEGRPFDASSSEDNGDEPEKKQARKPEKAAKPSFYQVKDGRMAKFGAGKSNESSTKDQALTFEDRMKKTKNSGGDSIINMSRQKSGNASLTFVPRDGRDDDSDDGGGYKKRGVGELGLESSRGRGRGRGGDRGSRGGGRGGARGGRGGRGGSRGGSSRGGPRGSRGGSRGGRGRGK